MSKGIEKQIGSLLALRGLYLVLAESCSGGLICHRITSIAGSSQYFPGGVVSYSNEAKIRLLGVKPETLALHGAVSRATAIEMARGVRHLLSEDFLPERVIGLSVTGFAGPAGGTPEIPVGTVWIGLCASGCESVRLHQWEGSRRQNIQYSAQAALQFLEDYLKGRIDNQ